MVEENASDYGLVESMMRTNLQFRSFNIMEGGYQEKKTIVVILPIIMTWLKS
jgi:hypothetical protein